MNALGQRLSVRVVAAATAVALVAATFLLLRHDTEMRTVTAHFPRAVSVYQGTDVRILGVNVGRVTAVIPEGNSVRVEMQYDAQYEVPANAKAVIVTPTLVADRFVQLTPAYTGGTRMADGADIPLPDTGVPVELDRIYSSLRDLSEALGKNGVNKDGTLDHVLAASRRNLGGQGRLGNRMIRNLSRAASTFGQGSGDLFETVTQLAKFSQVLGNNDRLVRAFVTDLSGVSGSLASERVQLQRALEAVARAVGTVREFVHGNRAALVTDLEKLTRVMKNINSERGSIDDALQVAPLALGNLAVAFNNQTGSIGSRIGVNGTFGDLDGFLCSIVMQSGMPRASKDLACKIFKQIEPVENQAGKQPATGRQSPSLTGIEQRSTEQYVQADKPSLAALMGGAA